MSDTLTRMNEPESLEVVDHETFLEEVHDAMDDSPYLGFITIHPIEVMREQGMVAFMTNGGATGMLVIPDYDNTGVVGAATLFNVGPKGAGLELFEYIVEMCGVNDIDAFEGYLVDTYREMGFETYNRIAFDPKYAHDWNYDRFGRPDVHYMSKKWIDDAVKNLVR
jgi:hypothetical protein